MLGDQLLRVHGPHVKTEEVIAVVNHLKLQGEPEYLDSVTSDEEESKVYRLALMSQEMIFMIKQSQLFVERRKLLLVLFKGIYR